MRLDKFISHALGLSRGDARKEIKNKCVKVNGKVVQKNDLYIDEYDDLIEHNDKKIEYKEFIYLMMNKPQGVISATQDKQYKTVIDILDPKYKIYDLFPMGRLDIDTEGLLILTNNGSLAHKILSPTKDVYKKYYCEVDGEFLESDVEVFLNGMELYDGNKNKYTTKKAYLEIIDSKSAYISICEGKYHQVKKMCLKLNKTVTYLKRLEMKNIILDNSLAPGEYRELTLEEINMLIKSEN